MISELRIRNFKSIRDLTLDLGRVTVLIGENGSGKSNILEAITFAGAAKAGKLDNEFLANRGIRVTEEAWMRAAFPEEDWADSEGRSGKYIGIDATENGEPFKVLIAPHYRKEDGSFEKWQVLGDPKKSWTDEYKEKLTETIQESFKDLSLNFLNPKEVARRLAVDLMENEETLQNRFPTLLSRSGLSNFLIYAPENYFLRNPTLEGAITPLSPRGEGLFRLLQSFSSPEVTEKYADRFHELKEHLKLFGWFEDLQASTVPLGSPFAEPSLQIRDCWVKPGLFFNQKSANEGFLYVLFYLALFLSWRTPKMFAIDNVDNALNPKLCVEVTKTLVELARKYDKQAILTTHNPAVLDGLNLKDEDVRLLVVRRDSTGATVVRRIHAPEPVKGAQSPRLSQLFMEGLIGGLPKNF